MYRDVTSNRPRTEGDLVTPRQRRVMTLLEDRARRTELLAALATAGGLPSERAACVLCAELGELEISAREVGLDGLVAMVRATRRVIEHLGGVKVAHWRQREVVVLDDNEITRDLIALALQAEGHRVRTAANVAELAYLVSERKPHVLLTEVRLPDAPAARFCSYLRRTIVNLSKNLYRRLAVERSYLERRSVEGRDQRTDPDVAESESIRGALLSLPERQRAAIVLRYYEDLPESEIATLLRCRPATVRSLVARGLERLRRIPEVTT